MGGAKDGHYSDDRYLAGRPMLYAKDCYWDRGTRYCALYCYVEINGKHYCHEREFKAVPQGDPYQPVRPDTDELYRRPRPY